MAKLIDLYKEWMESESLPQRGLCNCDLEREYKNSLKLFKPTDDDYEQLAKEHKPTVYYGYGECSINTSSDMRAFDFTPLRQTIVLLICAMHDEI